MVAHMEGIVRSYRDGVYKRNYLAGIQKPQRGSRFVPNIPGMIYEIVNQQPGITQSQIAAALQKSRQVINYHIKAMEEDNILRILRVGGETMIYIAKNKET